MDTARIPDDTQVCRCEEIVAADVRNAIREGASSINDVKRRTRAGMGVCQGIFCTRTIGEMIHDVAGEPFDRLDPMTARPPARLIPLERLATTDE